MAAALPSVVKQLARNDRRKSGLVHHRNLPYLASLLGIKIATNGIGVGVLVMSMCKTSASLRRMALYAAVPAVVALAAAGTMQAFAQSREQRPPAFTDEQVQRGKAIYQKNCQDCHGSTLDNGEFGGAPLKGSYFRQHWGSGDVSALFGYVNTLMPPDRPGQLTAQSYVDLTAFLLSNNGYAAGAEELTADQDAQRKMTMKK
jgi:mono/diheme cytochrome c family protein